MDRSTLIVIIIIVSVIVIGLVGFLIYWFAIRKVVASTCTKFTTQEYKLLKDGFKNSVLSNIDFNDMNKDYKIILGLYQWTKDGDPSPSITHKKTEVKLKDAINTYWDYIDKTTDHYIVIVLRSTISPNDAVKEIKKGETFNYSNPNEETKRLAPKFLEERLIAISTYYKTEISRIQINNIKRMIIITDNEMATVGNRIKMDIVGSKGYSSSPLKNNIYIFNLGEIPTYKIRPDTELVYSIVSDKDPYYIDLTKDKYQTATDLPISQPTTTYDCIDDYRSTIHYMKYNLSKVASMKSMVSNPISIPSNRPVNSQIDTGPLVTRFK